MSSKASHNDFHSLLSVFRDATSTSDNNQNAVATTSANRPGQSRNGAVLSSGPSAPNAPQPDRQPQEALNSSFCNNKESLPLAATSDPSFSPSIIKERIERLLQIHQIRRSTTSNATSSVATNSAVKQSSNILNSVHIAICATVVDDFPHEALWKKWILETGGEFQLNDDCKSNLNEEISTQIGKSEGSKKDDACINGQVALKSGMLVEASAELYIHAKNPERVGSEWLRSKTLPHSHRPNWNDVRIIRAMLSLLEAALCNEKTTHILFCTESCIPIVTLKEAARSILLDEVCLWEDSVGVGESGEIGAIRSKRAVQGVSKRPHWDRSYVDCYDRSSPRCTRFDEHNCWDILRDAIPSEAIYKALPGWCFLSRKHAQSILNLPSQLGGMNLWPAFERVWAPEEVYFPTALAICGHLEDVLDENSTTSSSSIHLPLSNTQDTRKSSQSPHSPHNPAVIKRAITHSQWDTRAVNHRDRAHPLTYDECFDDTLVQRVRKEGCLFLRKVKRSLDVGVWEEIVVHRRRGRWSGVSAGVVGEGREKEEERSESRGRNNRSSDGYIDRRSDHYHSRGRKWDNSARGRDDWDRSRSRSRDYHHGGRDYHSGGRRNNRDDGHWRRKRDRDDESYERSYERNYHNRRRY